ncbi:uncharacterized protein LOC143190520 isoform X1 [Rhynchophorus ferrugineus]|uniref:uncharacterized protein LOC143190520 isoform X1 n=3 Tax=Rhynchophorus ferrugineus TaxID=354439 RepID=UPI003FCD737A
MNLSKGICSFCQCITKIVVPDKANYVISKISECFGDRINETKLIEIKNEIKVCPVCLYDLKQLAQLKQNMITFKAYKKKCSLCITKEDLIYINNLYYFDSTTHHITPAKISNACLCLSCLKYLDLFKKNIQALLNMFPNLFTNESNRKGNKAKIRETVKSEKVRQKVKNHSTNTIAVALNHLKPLKDMEYNVKQYKADRKIYEKIAFVRLESLRKSLFEDRLLRSYNSDSSLTDSKKKMRKKSIPRIQLSKQKQTIKTTSPKQLYVNLLRIDPEIKEEPLDDYNTDDCFNPDQEIINEMDFSMKSRKSVSFSDVLTVETKEQKKHNVDGTPLKSLLKSHKPSLINFMDTMCTSEEKSGNSEIINSDFVQSDDNNLAEIPPIQIGQNEQKPDTTEDESILDEDLSETEQIGTILKSESNAEKQLLLNVAKSPDSSDNVYVNENSNDTEKPNEGSEQFVLELSDDEDESMEKTEENEVSSTSPEKSVSSIAASTMVNFKSNTILSNMENILIDCPDTSAEDNSLYEISEAEPPIKAGIDDQRSETPLVDDVPQCQTDFSVSEKQESKIDEKSSIESDNVVTVVDDEAMPFLEVPIDSEDVVNSQEEITDKKPSSIDSAFLTEAEQEDNIDNPNGDHISLRSSSNSSMDEITNEPKDKQIKHDDDNVNVHSNKEITQNVESETIEHNLTLNSEITNPIIKKIKHDDDVNVNKNKETTENIESETREHNLSSNDEITNASVAKKINPDNVNVNKNKEITENVESETIEHNLSSNDEITNASVAKKINHDDDVNVNRNKEATENIESETIEHNFLGTSHQSSIKRSSSDEITNAPVAKKIKHDGDVNVNMNKETTESVETETIEHNSFLDMLNPDNNRESDISDLAKDVVETMLEKLCS